MSERDTGRCWHARMAAAMAFFSVVCPASAQEPDRSPPGISAAMPEVNREVTADPDPAQRAVVAELACLADPQIFPCDIRINVKKSGLEAAGWIADESLRPRVLSAASEASGLAVFDSLQIDAARMQKLPAAPSIGLRRAAMSALIQALPSHTYDIRVETWGNGQVVLKGRVDSDEEKLTASRCLRAVGGCTCVLNQLTVRVSASRLSAEQYSNWERGAAGTLAVPGGRQVQAELGYSSADAEHSEAAAEVSWAAARVKGVRATIARICRWRPKLPGLFPQPSLIVEAETAIPLGGTVAENSQPAKQEILQIPVQPDREAPLAAAIDDGVQLASAKDVPQSADPGCIFPAEMRDYIARSCGSVVKDVQVCLSASDLLEISISTDTELNAELLCERIMQLPELSRYRLSLTITAPLSQVGL